ncbi:MAG: helix-turn-helix domain-containing protein [Candidatus Scatomorpha sp.]
MNIFWIQRCISVVKHHSLSKAVMEMLIAQLSMSQQISALEDELVTTLFIWGWKGLMLTEVGEFLANRTVTTLLAVICNKLTFDPSSGGVTNYYGFS